MSKVIKLPQAASYPFPWILTLLLAGFAWVLTYQQLLEMHFLPMYGTMGLPLGPFLLFWTIMMAAMMLPALAPMVSVRYEHLRQQSLSRLIISLHLLLFLLGYLLVWCCFGIPIFVLAVLSNQLMLHVPLLGIGLGIMLFIFAGIYQMTPVKRRFLTHCNPSLGCHVCCVTEDMSAPSPFVDLKVGIVHSLSCLGCCGNLMIILLAVGLMNLPWMLIVTLVIFIEKVWHNTERLNPLIGMALVAYGVLAFISPALLSGLYVQ